MVSRYEVANLMLENWSLLSWKGDEHTKGVYFNKEHGYLIERTYSVRVKHDEPAPSVFYTPNVDGANEEDVVAEYPYMAMTKSAKNYNHLFCGDNIRDSMLDRLFNIDSYCEVALPVEPLILMLNKISNKRERDRSLLLFKISGSHTEVAVIDKKKEEPIYTKRFELTPNIACNEKRGVIYMTVNANNVLHALNLLKSEAIVLFSMSHDKIKLISTTSTPNVEAVISIPKHSFLKDIE